MADVKPLRDAQQWNSEQIALDAQRPKFLDNQGRPMAMAVQTDKGPALRIVQPCLVGPDKLEDFIAFCQSLVG